MADMIQGFKKGAARYITKPIDTEELIREIKTTLRNA
jgi:DNA-binding response OmpR family regulator